MPSLLPIRVKKDFNPMWLCLMDSLHKSLWNNAGIPSFFLAGIKVLIKVAKKTLNLILALGLLLIAKSIKKWTDSQLPEKKGRYEYIYQESFKWDMSNNNICWKEVRMAQFLKHSVSHFIKLPARPKTYSQSIKRFLSLAVSWVKVVKKWVSF